MKMHAILRRTASALVLIPLLAAADQAPVRDLRNDAEAPIVVTGQRLTREQARERAVTFVRQVGVARGEQPASRWTDPVCPRVLGIASLIRASSRRGCARSPKRSECGSPARAVKRTFR